MKKGVSTIGLVSAATLAVLISGASLLSGQLWLTTRRAENALEIVQNLTVGEVISPAIRGRVASLARDGSTRETLNNGDEQEAVFFDNFYLSRLRLSRYRRFTLRLQTHEGVLIQKEAEAYVEGDCRIEAIVRAASTPEADIPKHFSTVPAGFDKPVAVASVIDYNDAAKIRIKDDWTFDLGYLKSLHQCRDGRKILPALAR